MKSDLTRPILRETKSPAPSAFVRKSRFGDHDELSSLIRGADSEFLQRTSGAFKGEFTDVGLDSGSIQFGRVALPYIARGSPTGNRTFFLIHLKPDSEFLCKGRPVEPGFIIGVAPGADFQALAPGRTYWALVSFDPTSLNRSLTSINGEGVPGFSLGTHVLFPRKDLFNLLTNRLRAVHAAVETNPSFLGARGSRRGIEESILTALSLAVGSSVRARPEDSSAQGRSRAAARVEAYLSGGDGQPLYLADLCSVAGVSERTLRSIFQEMYGMSPVQYLKLRRLSQARAALRKADPERSTVKEIAHRYGIWHLGRFASEYRELFGETPLETLRKHCAIEHAPLPPLAAPRVRRNPFRNQGLV